MARRGPIPGKVFLGKVEERASDIGVIGDEASVEIGEAKERADIFHLGGSWPIGDPIEFNWVHGQLTRLDDHAEVFNLVGGEFTLFELQMKVELSHTLQDMFSAFFMEGGVGGIDEEIIHIDNQPSFSNHVAEGVVHESLEGSGGIGEAKEHYGGFKESIVGDEGCLPLMTVFDSYVVIPPPYVELGEDLGISQFVHEIRDEGEGVGVTDGVFIDISIVLAGAKSSIFLFDEEER